MINEGEIKDGDRDVAASKKDKVPKINFTELLEQKNDQDTTEFP